MSLPHASPQGRGVSWHIECQDQMHSPSPRLLSHQVMGTPVYWAIRLPHPQQGFVSPGLVKWSSREVENTSWWGSSNGFSRALVGTSRNNLNIGTQDRTPVHQHCSPGCFYEDLPSFGLSFKQTGSALPKSARINF